MDKRFVIGILAIGLFLFQLTCTLYIGSFPGLIDILVYIISLFVIYKTMWKKENVSKKAFIIFVIMFVFSMFLFTAGFVSGFMPS